MTLTQLGCWIGLFCVIFLYAMVVGMVMEKIERGENGK
jgi:hypothetical protein